MLDGLTFVGSAWLVGLIVLPAGLAQARQAMAVGGWLSFVDGLRYLRHEPSILVISLVKGGGSLVWGAVNVLEIVYAKQVFPLKGGASFTLGIIYAISGLGTGFGPLLMRRWFGDRSTHLRWAITVGFGLLAVGLWGLSAAPNFAWFSVATLVRTVGSGTIWVFSAALLQMSVPDRFRGRVFAFEFAFLTLTQSISIFWAGYAQDSLGWDVWQVTVSMAISCLVVGGLWFAFQLWSRPRPGPSITTS